MKLIFKLIFVNLLDFNWWRTVPINHYVIESVCRFIINQHGNELTQLMHSILRHVVSNAFFKKLKNFEWLNSRVGQGFFKEMRTNLSESIIELHTR